MTMIDMDQDEEGVVVEECGICGGDIIIEPDCEEEDVVYCNDCEAEYLIRSMDPVRLQLLDDDDEIDDDDESYKEEYD